MNTPEKAFTLNNLSVPKVNLRLLPEPYLAWIKSRPDILRGHWSFQKKTTRNIDIERMAIENHFRIMDQSYPEYTKFLSHILTNPQNNNLEKGMAGMSQLGRRSISPMENECRVSVVMPARGEEKNIYNTLHSYMQQVDKDGKSLNPKLWEINIIVNAKDGERHDGTYDEAMRFKKDYPQIRINTVEITLQNSWMCVGFLRKLAGDISLIRSYTREKQKESHYIESDDADLTWVDPRLVDTIISTFDANPELDSLTGCQEKDLRTMAEVEHVFLSRRFWDIMTVQAFHYLYIGKIVPTARDFNWSRPFTYGVNTAHTSEANALIGGYDWEIKVGEDLDIGKRISLLRGKVEDGLFLPELRSIGLIKTRTNSSPRRYLWALYKDVGHPYSVDNFERNEARALSQDDMISKMPPTYRRINESNKRFYEKELWFLYESLRKIIPDEELSRKIVTRTMIILGFKLEDFTVTKDEILINNSERFSAALEDYRQRKPYKSD